MISVLSSVLTGQQLTPPAMPSCLPWKYWTNKQRASSSKHNTDYIYLQWHFMTSQQDEATTTTTTTITPPRSSLL